MVEWEGILEEALTPLHCDVPPSHRHPNISSWMKANPQDGLDEAGGLCVEEEVEQLEAPSQLKVNQCSNPMDANEHDFDRSYGAAEETSREKPPPRQERRRRERERSRQEYSTVDMRNDIGSGHLPLQVENDIADLELLLETCNPASRGYLQGCLDSAWETINHGTVDEPRRKLLWRHWCTYSQRWHVSPYLETCSKLQQAAILSAFAVGIREGNYG